MNDRNDGGRSANSKSGLHKSQQDETSASSGENGSLPEARRIGRREEKQLLAERPVLDAVHVEFCV